MTATEVRAGRQVRGDEYFDELEVGDWIHSRARTITETDVAQFAALTWDHNPAHTDAVTAARGIFGERVAHGLLGLAVTIGLVPNSSVAGLRRFRNVVFKSPLRFGDTVHVEGVVAVKRDYSEELGLLTGRWRLVNQDGATILKFEIDALWRRHPEGGDDRDG